MFKKLLDLGWSQKDIAAKSGMTGGRISQILELMTMPEPIKAMVAAGEVSASMAIQTVKAEGAKATEKLTTAVTAAKAEGKTRAMPKHTGERGPSAMRIIKDAIEQAILAGRLDESEDLVTLSFPDDVWIKISDALKL